MQEPNEILEDVLKKLNPIKEQMEKLDVQGEMKKIGLGKIISSHEKSGCRIAFMEGNFIMIKCVDEKQFEEVSKLIKDNLK